MIRRIALTLSFGLHLVAWCVMHWPSPLHHPTDNAAVDPRSTLQTALVELPSQEQKTSSSVESVSPESPNPDSQASPVKQPDDVHYASRQLRTREPITVDQVGSGAPSQSVSTSKDKDEPGTGDLDQEGLAVPQLRIQKLNVELVERLIESRQARLVVIYNDHPVSFVVGPLSRPLGVQTIEEQSELDEYSERMLEIPAGMTQNVREILNLEEVPSTCRIRLALRKSFDQALLQAQLRAVEATGKPISSARVTIGRLVLTAANGVEFIVDEVK